MGGRTRDGVNMRALPAAILLCILVRAAPAAELPVVVAGGDQSAPDVARAGATWLIVWQDERDIATTGRDIYAARVTNSGAVLDPGSFPVLAADGPQDCPKVASDGSSFLVVWQDDRNDNGIWRVRAARVTVDGDVLDADGIIVSELVDSQPLPVVCWAGTHYLLAWQQDTGTGGTDVCVARVGAHGVLIDATPVVVGVTVGVSVGVPVEVAVGVRVVVDVRVGVTVGSWQTSNDTSSTYITVVPPRPVLYEP